MCRADYSIEARCYCGHGLVVVAVRARDERRAVQPHRACCDFFHKKAGYCLVYHENTFMAEQLILERLLESQIQEMGLPRAVRQCMQDADLPPPKVPDSDDEVSSFGGGASENDQDAQKT